MKRLLLHSCCAPCSIYPVSELKRQDISPTIFFFNHNIHPFKEFRRRLNCLEDFCKNKRLSYSIHREYELQEFLRQAVFYEKTRCQPCYRYRMTHSVEYAKEKGFDAFSTTLLYSRHQNHALIRKIGEELAEKYDIEFFYQDFREGWQEGIDQSIAEEMYRQPYCGCIYSEQERYDKRFQKKQRREK